MVIYAGGNNHQHEADQNPVSLFDIKRGVTCMIQVITRAVEIQKSDTVNNQYQNKQYPIKIGK